MRNSNISKLANNAYVTVQATQPLRRKTARSFTNQVTFLNRKHYRHPAGLLGRMISTGQDKTARTRSFTPLYASNEIRRSDVGGRCSEVEASVRACARACVCRVNGTRGSAVSGRRITPGAMVPPPLPHTHTQKLLKYTVELKKGPRKLLSIATMYEVPL
jgi:hypothetical protein